MPALQESRDWWEPVGIGCGEGAPETQEESPST